MATTFSLFYLGTAPDLDSVEGNLAAENASALNGLVFGSASDPIASHLAKLTPGSTGFAGGSSTAYDADNTESFTIDGGAQQLHDATMIYNNTVIRYTDGTTATVQAIVMQDTTGRTYLLPPQGTAANSYSAALIAKPIETVTLGTAAPSGGTDVFGMTADRYVMTLHDYIVEGTAGNDSIGTSYAGDPEGDRVDASDGIDGSNNDVIKAEAGNDVVFAGLGNDSVEGGSGDDTLYGEAGDDRLQGGDGNDRVSGGAGQDSLNGDLGNDALFGGIGADTLDGGAGNDVLVGGTTSATIANGSFSAGGANWTGTDMEFGTENVYRSGGSSSNTLAEMDGNAGQITVMQQSFSVTEPGAALLSFDGIVRPGATVGTDGYTVEILDSTNTVIATMKVLPTSTTTWQTFTLEGNFATAGTYTLRFTEIGNNDSLGALVDNISFTTPTGADDDSLSGGAGNDSLYGNAGNDTLDGGSGNDSQIGGAGDDRFALTGGFGNDTILGGETGETTGDTLDATSQSAGLTLTFSGAEAGTLGDGTSTASFSQIETVELGTGNDSVFGGAGNEAVYGGAGDDSMSGGAGNDSLYGGAGGDVLSGGAGNDGLYGGADADVFYGGAGDTIDGGATGDDRDVLDLRAYGHPGTNVIYDPLNHKNGTVEFLDSTGAVTGTLAFSNIEQVIACFTPGARIMTDTGEVAVERLQAGDLVLTRDNGYQPIVWIGRRDLTSAELIAAPRFNPVRIAAGALGPGLPERDMIVSPQHRMLIASPRSELMFGEHEVLVTAKHLTRLQGITRIRPKGVSYIHFMFENHEILRADGTWTESFQPGALTLAGLGAAQRAEILALFPELGCGATYAAARMTLKDREARVLIET